MDQQLLKRSDIERMVATGEAVKEPPRQAIRETRTGRIIQNNRLPEMLPTYLIAVQSKTLIYNDVDVEAFNREVRQQTTRILDAIGDERFDNAGIAYQQFIDQYDACFEMPSMNVLAEVKRRGIDLYAVLENLGNRLMADLSISNQLNEETECRFYAVTDAHINLFFYMLTLNLALHNKIDNVQRQLRMKLGLLDNRLRTLLNEYIYANQNGYIQDGKPVSETLYGWILLEENQLDTARVIYKADASPKKPPHFSDLHAAVMSVYKINYLTPDAIRDRAFRGNGFSDIRSHIAHRLCYYLNQTAQIRAYLDELTQGSENNDTEDATVDVRSFLLPSRSQIATQ
ncbi:hypothetical protein JTF19_19870 [Enterobacteriaceae bacterium RIT814]|nr:hypothetical protein [Enterobacteriaceae bacterium RIT 814]